MTRIACLSLVFLAAGCVPEAPRFAPTPGEVAAAAAPYPTLAPLSPIIQAGETQAATSNEVDALQAQGAATEARAEALRRRPLE